MWITQWRIASVDSIFSRQHHFAMLTREDIPFLIEKGLISRKTHAVYDGQFNRALREIPWAEWLSQPSAWRHRPQYLERIDQWIHSSHLNHVQGLERFRVRHLINGTTQTFDEVYMKYAARRLRVLRGEYAYHRRVVAHHLDIEEAPLEENDYVILSAPFCTTGERHPRTYEIFEEAGRKKVPVIVDCAYFGTCLDFELDVNHPAIESVSFSLSKGLGLGDIRSGVRYSNLEDSNPIAQQNAYDHTVLCAARIGLYMMEKFGPDHIPTKFRAAQEEVCRELGLKPTPCMHLALGDENWKEFQIAPEYNRVGIRELVKARFKKEI
jgi:hypothetical protein